MALFLIRDRQDVDDWNWSCWPLLLPRWYLSTPGGSCGAATTTRCRTASGKNKDFLPLLLSKCFSLQTRGNLCIICSKCSSLYSWSMGLKNDDLYRLERNEGSMLKLLLNFRAEDNTKNSTVTWQIASPNTFIHDQILPSQMVYPQWTQYQMN